MAAVPEIIEKISTIAANHFSVPGLVLSSNSTAKDVKGWDSIAHIQFMMRIEEEFRIRFKTVELNAFRNIGELAERIAIRSQQ